MNELQLNPIQVDAADTGHRGVELKIDGCNFIDLVREVEQPQAKRLGQLSIAGAYEWVANTAALRKELAEGGQDPDDKIMVLACECGEPGCWPLLARIQVNEAEVVWSEFEQPHRGPDSAAGHWRYDELGPFVFSRTKYVEQLEKLEADAQSPDKT
ncbi:hypothetical protein [Ideonella sp.]|uniref:hypothetical protein n=1 Tax=Ideonella sp. TaxID=1929293 RepID=UPI0035B3E114